MSIHPRTYRFRMWPSRQQEQSLFRQAGACRWVWNWALARRKAYYARHGESISAKQLSAELTALKEQPETAWLKDVDSQALQQVLRDLDRAFRNFFERRAGFPKFKSRKRCRPAFRIPQRVTIMDGKIYVPKIGWVRIRQSQDVDGTTRSATFKQDACGHWYVTLVVNFDLPDVALPAPDPDRVVGLDAGLKDFLVLSSAERVEAPRFYRKAQKKLRRAQRVFARRQRGSKRRTKARQRIARVQQKTANQTPDFLHKHSTDLTQRFDGVCIEDVSLKGLARTKLAKSFNDAAHGEFRRMLDYKSVWRRKLLIAVGRFYPSSKTCCSCGAIKADLILADRQWTCSVCGIEHDRDLCAATNIRTEGLRLFAVGHTEKENARGVLVRPCASGATDAEPRIPRL
jgi:putative transposase